MTATVTRPATCSCASSPSASRRSCASPTSRRATAATSSSCCCPTRPAKARWKWPSASAAASPTRMSRSAANGSFPASASASPATRKMARRSMRSPRTPTARSTPPSRTAATARSSSAPRRKPQFPILTDHRHAELPVRPAFHEPEAELRIYGARGGQVLVRPEDELAVAATAGEGDAFLDQPLAEALPPDLRLDEQQPQLCDVAAFIDHKHRADALDMLIDAAFGDPAALALGVELAQELADDVGNERLEQGTPAVFAFVQDAVALHHPPHVAGPMRPQRDLGLGFARLEHLFDRAERADEGASLRHAERCEHLAGDATRALIERGERLAALRRERQPYAPGVVPRALALHQALALQALQQAAEVAEVDVEFGAELAGRTFAALADLVEHARLGQRERQAEVARLQHADAARIEAVEAPHRVDMGHARSSAGILAFVK